MIKKLIFIILFMLCFITSVSANETDVYKEQLNDSGVNSLDDYLPDTAKDFLNGFNIDISDSGWVNTITTENALTHIFNFIKSGATAPFKTFGTILALIILSSVISSATKINMTETINFVTILTVCTALISPLYSVITAAVQALNGCATFMGAFVPIFAGIVAASGKTLTSVSMSGILLLAVNFVSFIANSAVIPLMSGHLSLSIASSVSPILQNTNLAAAIKKISLWVMGFISTLLIGILSIQTVVNSSADSLTLRTAKFIVGSTIPVAGGVLSEALSTVTASLSLLRSSVGIWGVFICAITFLPIICELLLWRLGLFILCFFCDTFCVGKLSSLLKSIDGVLSVLIGIILLTAALFIISLAVIILGGKGV